MKRLIITLAALAIAGVATNADIRANLRGFAAQHIPAAGVDDANAEKAAIGKWQKAPGFYAAKLYVQDGDTIVAKGNRHIRLLCIDAPEKEQHYGNEAKAFLAQLVKGGASIRTAGKDQYGRILAVVIADIDGKQIIANHEMVRRGYAWVYGKFSKSCGLPEEPLYAMERKARRAKEGLWQNPNPAPPWQWRYQNRR